MHIALPCDIKTQFQSDFDLILGQLDHQPSLVDKKNEIFDVWYASPFIRRVCLAQPQWLHNLVNTNGLHTDYSVENYKQILHAIISEAQTTDEVQRILRQQRVSQFARIAWRDLQNYTSVQQILKELSDFAEVCIDSALSWCFAWLKLQTHVGEFEKTLPQQVIVFALGKLGGGELNFSSDVDLVFAYHGDTNHSQDEQTKAVGFYLKLIQLLIKVLAEQTQDGFVFRVDTRLRPFGDSGTLLPSLSAIDQYFQTHGRDWERYAWIKARAIAGEIELGKHFLEEVSPFVFRRYFDYGAAQSLREMKALVDQKARQKFSQENLKIGLGGIREIEFIAQMFQLIYGGKNKDLRTKATLKTLKQLEKYNLLSKQSIAILVDAYIFLRKAENGLQIREDQQTHILPTDEVEKKRYSFLMGFQTWEEFYSEYKLHTSNVNTEFQSLLHEKDLSENESDVEDYVLLWQQIEDEGYSIKTLEKYFAKDKKEIYEYLNSFHQSGTVKQLVPVARQRLDRFVPIMLQCVSRLDKPALVLTRFIKILNKIVQRSTYISLLTENQTKLSKLFNLIEVSDWVTQYVATHPLLLDEILRMEKSYVPPSLDEMRQQLRVSMHVLDDDLEKYMESLREFKHAQVLQIAAADIVEDFPIMKVSDHLSWLAEVCIENAVKRAHKDLVDKHGEPICEDGSRKFKANILIVEYGKLGGLELGYGSDLDLVFLHNSAGANCETNGEKKLRNEIFFTRLVQRTIHILSTVTSAGKVFDVDARLRPYGQSGPIVSTIAAYEKYLKNEAWLWEHQALIRARPVTNDQSLQEEFSRIRREVLCQLRDIMEVKCSIIEMREKILLEHGSKDGAKFNIKKDKGGIVDIEFIVQFLVLAHAHKNNKICVYTDNIRILDACSQTGLIEQETAEELKEIYLVYRKHLHKLNLQMLPETVMANEFEEERSIVQNHWASLLN